MTTHVRETHNQQLQEPVVAAAYLNEALADNDSAVILMAIRHLAEAQEGGMAGLAQRSALGRESLYKTLSATGNPKLASFTKIIEALGLRLTVEAAS